MRSAKVGFGPLPGPRTMSRSALTVATALAAGMLVGTPAAVAARGLSPAAPQTKPVPVTAVAPHQASTTAMPAFRASVSWPAAGSAVAQLPAADATRPASRTLAADAAAGRPGAMARAGSLPVSVGRAAGESTAATPTQVAVALATHTAATDAGVDGEIVSLHRADGVSAAGKVAVTVDYSSFAEAYGGDYASRLRLVALPQCALTTPQAAACRAQTPIASSSNDTATGTVSATVSLPAAGPLVMALDSSGSGGGGDFTSTPLKASGSWTAGGSSGAFTYDYSLIAPAVPGSLEPELKLAYDSQQVDGLTSATNNQPSWVGDGWSYTPGFVERSFPACQEAAPSATKTGDYCWSDTSNTITLSLNGINTALVHDPTTGWHLKDDNGDKVTLSTGAVNGDDNSLASGEYWVVTATDGTKYYFGQNQLPGYTSGKPTTNSVDTMPVFSTASGQPCYDSTFKSSYCATMAYRWNLDYVVDTRGDAIAYYYNTETNHYGADNGAETLSYVRGSYLTKIDYGFRAGQAYSTSASPAAQVLFTVNGRCNSSPTGCATSTLTSSTASTWPDVPYDVNCASSCTASKYWAPTFWSEFELTKVQTQVLVGTGYKPADLYSMTYSFPSTGDASSPALWLASVTRQGQDAASSSDYLSMKVTFDGSPLANRVNLSDGYDPLTRHRLSKITTETGEIITVVYSGPGCASSTPSSADSDTMLCYPQYWSPNTSNPPILDWFNKYVVLSVAEQDTTGGGPVVQTSYNYVGNPAWHYDDNPLAKKKYRTWDQWRGYATVQTSVGAAPDPVTQKQETYFRGMDGDQNSSGGTTSATTTDSRNESIPDSDWLAGMTRESITYDGPNGSVISDEITDPWSQQTADQSRSSAGLPTLYAYQVATAGTRSYAPLAAGGTRESQTTYTRDSYGRPTQTSTRPDVSDSSTDTCTTVSYADNTGTWIMNLPAKTTTTSVACGTTPNYPSQLVSQALSFYDGSAANGASPTAGEVTMSQRVAAVDSAGAATNSVTTKSTVDEYGRTLTATDGNGKTTSTAYSPATGAEPMSMTVTDPLGHQTTTEYDPVTDQPTSVTDPAGYVTTATYDALGRRTAVWRPGEPTSAPASVKFAYTVSASGLSVVSTSTLGPQGAYRVSETLYDALLRPRETQLATLDGGRDISLTWYDSAGQKVKETAPFYTTGAPDGKLVSVADGAVPSESGYVHDGAGRRTRQIAYNLANETWETDTSYQGSDQTTETPPGGGTPSVVVKDAMGRTAQLEQFDNSAPTGTPATVTTYAYTPTGQLAGTKDSANNTSTYTYDLLGRVTKQADPDGGITTSAYDADGNLTATTDARGKTTTNQYDADNRKTAAYDTTGNVAPSSSNEVASWLYDSRRLGLLTATTSYQHGLAFTDTVMGYNTFGEPTGEQVTVPSGAITGALASTYTQLFTYDTYTGLRLSQTDQAAGGLAQETIDYGYDAYGRPINVGGTDSYVNQLTYTEFDQASQYTFGTSGTFTQLTLGYDPQTQALDNALTTASTASTPIDNTTYRYNNAQEVTQVDSVQGETGSQVVNDQCFAYNNLQQLTTAWTASASGAGACATAPSAGNAATVVGGYQPYWQSWAFDGGGNRTSETTHDITGNTSADVAVGYKYPAAGSATDQPNTVSSLTKTVGGSSTATSASYAYDAAGETTAVTTPTNSQNLQWDDQGRLASDTTTATANGTTTSGTTDYLYGAGGSLLLRQDPATASQAASTTLFLADEQLVLSGGTVTGTRYYTLGGAAVAARSSAGSVAYLIPDRQGSDVLQIDAATQSAARESYTPYGTLRSAAPSAWIGGTGYAGGNADPATGLVNLGAREYDPATGRFLSLDPIAEVASPQQMNGYAYAANNPTTHSDPSGLYIPDCPGCWIAIASRNIAAWTPPPVLRPDYVITTVEVSYTFRVAVPGITPSVEKPKPKLLPPLPFGKLFSQLGGKGAGGCLPLAGGFGGCVSVAGPSFLRPQPNPGQTIAPPTLALAPPVVGVKDWVLVTVTFSASYISARNGHNFVALGIGVAKPKEEPGIEVSVSHRAGYFLADKRLASDEIDHELTGAYRSYDGGKGFVGAAITKNLNGGWALEVGYSLPPESGLGFGGESGYSWRVPGPALPPGLQAGYLSSLLAMPLIAAAP